MEQRMLSIPRPQTRADCRQEARPCPWIGCRHHVLLEVAPAKGRLPTALRLNGRQPGSRDGRRPGLRAGAAAELVRSWIDEAAQRLVSLEYTCVLDFVDDNPDGATLARVADVLGVANQLIDQQVRSAWAKFSDRMREATAEEDRRLHEALGFRSGLIRRSTSP